MLFSVYFFFFQAEDGIRYLVRSRGLGDVYKRQLLNNMGSNSLEPKKILLKTQETVYLVNLSDIIRLSLIHI